MSAALQLYGASEESRPTGESVATIGALVQNPVIDQAIELPQQTLPRIPVEVETVDQFPAADAAPAGPGQSFEDRGEREDCRPRRAAGGLPPSVGTLPFQATGRGGVGMTPRAQRCLPNFQYPCTLPRRGSLTLSRVTT